jgi:hypothetical protein
VEHDVHGGHAKPASAEDYPVLDEDVAWLSPLTYEHINIRGRYSFAVPEAVAKGELGPLRDPGEDA